MVGINYPLQIGFGLFSERLLLVQKLKTALSLDPKWLSEFQMSICRKAKEPGRIPTNWQAKETQSPEDEKVIDENQGIDAAPESQISFEKRIASLENNSPCSYKNIYNRLPSDFVWLWHFDRDIGMPKLY